MNAGEDVEKSTSYTTGRNANPYSHCREQYGDSLKKKKKLRIKPLYDPAIPLLGIYLDETKTEKDMCAPLFMTALFTLARIGKQSRCPSADEWIRKLCFIYTMEYHSA